MERTVVHAEPPAALHDGALSEDVVVQALVDDGRLDPRSLDRARRLQAETGESLLKILPKLAMVADRDLAAVLAGLTNLPLVDPTDYPTEPVLETVLGGRFLKDSEVLPLSESDEGVVLATANPLDRFALDAVRHVTGRVVLPRIAARTELTAALERLYVADPDGRILASADVGEDDAVEQDVERLKDLASEAPVIRLVNRVIARAVERRASDIHVEPDQAHVRIRYRIDGALEEIEPPPARLRDAIVSRIKIMARLNIAERRLPQDGRMTLAVRGTSVDIRVATMPTLHGESVVMRILDRDRVALDFAALGIAGTDRAALLSIINRPHGIVLVTGPTGSGKTTTLYTALAGLSTPDRKIITVEDPVEYELPGIVQVEVRPQIGLTFAHLLRAMLRHNPNIIMVGEIRDSETAKIAVEAALTGHLVLSTVHTNDAVSSIPRLLDMGIEPYLLASTLNGAVGQRLVRTLCAECKRPDAVDPALIERLAGHRLDIGADVALYRPVGCSLCGGTGYSGRTTIIETVAITDRLRQLIMHGSNASELHSEAAQDGMRSMQDNGLAKALAGITSIEEVLQMTRGGS